MLDTFKSDTLLGPCVLDSLVARDGENLDLVSTDQRILQLITQAKTKKDWHFRIGQLVQDPETLTLLSIYRHMRAANTRFPLIYTGNRVESEGPQTLQLAAAKSMSALEVDGTRYLADGLEKLKPYFARLASNIEMETAKLGDEGSQEDEQKIAVSMVTRQVFEFVSDRKSTARLQDEIASIVIEGGIDLADYLLNLLSFILAKGGEEHKADLMRRSGLGDETYGKTMENLAGRMGLARPLMTFYWCLNHPVVPFSSIAVGQNHVMSGICPHCSNTLSSGSLLSILQPLRSALDTKDGILALTLAWHLERLRVRWRANSYIKGDSEDSEHDFVFELPQEGEYSLIECHSFSTINEPFERRNERIVQQLDQLKKGVASFDRLEIPTEKLFLVTNMPYDDSLQKLVDKKLTTSRFAQLREKEVHLLGPGNLSQLGELIHEDKGT